jgi:hypothetical protein
MAAENGNEQISRSRLDQEAGLRLSRDFPAQSHMIVVEQLGFPHLRQSKDEPRAIPDFDVMPINMSLRRGNSFIVGDYVCVRSGLHLPNLRINSDSVSAFRWQFRFL